MEDEFVGPAAVSDITGISVAALAQLRYERKGPRYYKPTPRTVLYRRSEVIEWVERSAQLTRASA